MDREKQRVNNLSGQTGISILFAFRYYVPLLRNLAGGSAPRTPRWAVRPLSHGVFRQYNYIKVKKHVVFVTFCNLSNMIDTFKAIDHRGGIIRHG